MTTTLPEQLRVPSEWVERAIHEARVELASVFAARVRDVERDEDEPEKEPAQSPSIPGRTYENPNEDEEYTPPETDHQAVADDEDDFEEDDEDEDDDLEEDEDDEVDVDEEDDDL